MIYADLPAGGTVFLDASVFIHHFEPNALYGPSATEFLERIENQEMIGVTTTHVLSEVAHRLMTIEAMQAFGWPSAGIAQPTSKPSSPGANADAISSGHSGNPPVRRPDPLRSTRPGWISPPKPVNKLAFCITMR